MTYSSHLFLLPPSCHPPPPPTCWFSVSVMSQQLQNDSQAQERERENRVVGQSCRISWENAPSSQKEHGGRIGCEAGQQQLTLRCLLRSCLLLRGGWQDGRLSSDPLLNDSLSSAAAMAKSPEVKLAVFGRAGVGKSGGCQPWQRSWFYSFIPL